MKLTIKDYPLQTATGKHIRMATMVVLPNGTKIKFMERMAKKEVLRSVEFKRRIIA